MSDEELRDELVTLLVAGHETTATSLAWSIERLVRHPRSSSACATRWPPATTSTSTPSARRRCGCARCCRSWRACSRRTSRSAATACPPGATVTPCIHLIHRRPDIYPEPRRFRPERFLEQPAGTYTWIPFGGGVRRCLGATFALFEMRQVLSSIVSPRGAAPRRAEAASV